MTTTDLETTPTTYFAQSLYKLGTGPRAELKRALLAEDPSLHTPIYRYVEPYVGNHGGWKRKAYYLVAALYGFCGKEDEKGHRLGLPEAVRIYERSDQAPGDEMSSVEKRFLALLDSDTAELPHRLRQTLRMITTGASRVSQPLDWNQILNDLLKWNYSSRTTQTKWARNFYQNLPKPKIEEDTDEGTA